MIMNDDKDNIHNSGVGSTHNVVAV